MSIGDFGEEFEHEFEEEISKALSISGINVPHAGVWLVGKIDREGPIHAYVLGQEYGDFREKLGIDTSTSNHNAYDSVRKYGYYLKSTGVINALSKEQARARGLRLEPDNESLQNSRTAVDRKYYVIGGVDTDFLDLPVGELYDFSSRMAVEAKGIPARVATPYKIWKLYNYLANIENVEDYPDIEDVSEEQLKEFVNSQEEELETPELRWGEESFEELAGVPFEEAKIVVRRRMID